VPPAPLPGHRLLASSVPGGRWPRAVASSRRSAPRFLAFEDPTPAGVDSAHATGTSPPWREIALPTAPVVRFPLLGFQRCPSVDIRALRPVPAGVVSRRSLPSAREMPLSPAPSAPAVLPGFDGLLRCAPRRVRAPGVRAQLALNPLPSAFLLQPTLGFMPFRLLLPVRALSIRPGAFRRPVRKNREVAGCVCRCVPGHALPFEAFPSSAAVPSSPTGDTFSPLQVAALVVVAVANRGADSAGGCRPQGLAPLPKSGGRVAVASGPAPMLPWASSWRGRVEDASAGAERTSRTEPR
jgi:hypothetical protein